MAGHNCESCAFRARYDANPTSFLGRLWRWHANWCPGFNGYLRSLPEQERQALAQKYDMKRHMS